MKYNWLQKNNNEKVIIFFNGWGMDENIVSHLEAEDFDVVVLFDYNDLSLDIDLYNYKEKHIVAWSMGVMISSLEETKEITKDAKTKTAICGTPYPIDDNYGIPKRIYDLTIKGFNEKSSQKFTDRMFSDNNRPEIVSNRTLESKKSELIKLKEYSIKTEPDFNNVIISEHDIIIPSKNQKQYWKNKNYSLIPTGHCPFLLYNKWAELVEICKKI